MQRFVLTLNLRHDPALALKYEKRHQAVWPAVLQSLQAAGVLRSDIYRVDYQLIMVLETSDDFSFERKAELDRNNPQVMQWEREMAQFQDVSDAGTDASQRWQVLRNVFHFAPE